MWVRYAELQRREAKNFNCSIRNSFESFIAMKLGC
jgi:hypothetical protein